jgi:hypothetical protein
MTTKNSNTKQTVTLTAEQYAKALSASHFLCSLVDLIDDSGLDLPIDSFTPLLINVSLDIRNLLRDIG